MKPGMRAANHHQCDQRVGYGGWAEHKVHATGTYSLDRHGGVLARFWLLNYCHAPMAFYGPDSHAAVLPPAAQNDSNGARPVMNRRG